jgi:hypothetical protein
VSIGQPAARRQFGDKRSPPAHGAPTPRNHFYLSKDKRYPGVTAIEYGLIAASIAVVIMPQDRCASSNTHC